MTILSKITHTFSTTHQHLTMIALSVGMTFGAGLASAATFEQSASFAAATGIQTNSVNSNYDTQDSIAFDAFDHSLGTLNSVTLVYDLANAITGTVSCPGRWPCSNSTITFDQFLLLDGSELDTTQATASASLGSFGRSGLVPLSLEGAQTAWSGSINLDVADFLDPSRDPLIGIKATASFSSTSSLARPSFDTSTTLSGDVTLIYDYEPAPVVPLPASAFLLLGGLAGLSFIRQKRS
jgi:hypothetical protein